MAAAATVEHTDRAMVNISGVTAGVQRGGRSQIVQVPAPLSAYAAGPLALVQAAGHKTLQVLARNDPRSREAADQLVDQSTRLGLQAAVLLTSPGATDYRSEVAAARARNAEAWIAYGIAEDAAETDKSFKRIANSPWLFLAQGVAEPEFIKRVGQDAEFSFGVTAYEPRANSSVNAAFVAAWRARWSRDPGVLAAHAYAGGLVLAHAVRSAGSLESARLRAARLALEIATPVGRYRVDEEGMQIGTKPVVVQILEGRREVVWPPALATAQWRLPYPRWDERRLHAPESDVPVRAW
jgi:branched-chain amino acid transport system substrate-binding protein